MFYTHFVFLFTHMTESSKLIKVIFVVFITLTLFSLIPSRDWPPEMSAKHVLAEPVLTSAPYLSASIGKSK